MATPLFSGAAGNKSTHSFRVSGQAGLHSQWYHMQADQDLLISARRPGDLYRFMVSPVFHYGGVRIPVTVVFSSRQTNTVTFQAPEQTFAQLLRNPLNTFRLAPSYKWARLTIGTQVLQHGDFTTGDIRLFGAGVDLTPGKWTISFFTGSSQRAIEPDSIRRIPGLYERRFQSARLAYGREGAFRVAMNVARMKDDEGSLVYKPKFVRPQEGLATSLQVAVPLAPGLTWQSEIAGSVFTRDTRSGLHRDSKLDELAPLVDLYYATRADYAGQTSLSYSGGMWGVRIRALYIGDGYVAPGFPYLQTDRIDITVDPNLRLLDSRLLVQGSFGYRRNNLSETKLQTTNQVLISLNTNMVISQSSGISASFSNFGLRTGFAYDTLRLEVVSTSMQLSPFFSFVASAGTHRINANLSYDEYNDTNLITGEKRDQQSFSVFAGHQFIFDALPLTSNLSVNYLHSLNQDFGLNGFIIQAGGIWTFGRDDMRVTLNLAYNRTSFADFSPDNAWLIRPGFRYDISRQLSARLDGSIRLFRYGSARPGNAFSENMIRTSVNYRF